MGLGRGPAKIAAAAAILLVLSSTAGAAAATHEVRANQFVWEPAALIVQPGDAIRWEWSGIFFYNVATYAGDDSFRSGGWVRDSSYEHVASSGQVWYRCEKPQHSQILASGACQGMCAGYTDRTVAPLAPVVSQPADGATLDTNPVVFGGTAEPFMEISLLVDGAVAGRAMTSALGSWSVSIVVSQGSHTGRARTMDVGGHTSALGPAFTFATTAPVPDTTAPRIVIDSTPGDLVITGPGRTYSGGAYDDRMVQRVEVRAYSLANDAGLVSKPTLLTVSCSGCGTGAAGWEATLPDLLAPGPYRIVATAVDGYDNKAYAYSQTTALG